MKLADLIKGSADPAAALKVILDGQEGEALKKSVKSLREDGVDPGLLVPYDEDSIEQILSAAEAANAAAADDVTTMLDAALEKSSKNNEMAEATATLGPSPELVDAIAEKVVERLGGESLIKSIKSIDDRLAKQNAVLEKSGKVIALTLGESLKKSGRTLGNAPAERRTVTGSGTPGKKKLGIREAKETFKRSLRLAQAKGDQAAIEKLSGGAILLDALDPSDKSAMRRVDEALHFAVGYGKN